MAGTESCQAEKLKSGAEVTAYPCRPEVNETGMGLFLLAASNSYVI
jgi:hypothetical protein